MIYDLWHYLYSVGILLYVQYEHYKSSIVFSY